MCSVPEVILSVLLGSFKFEPSGKPVVWNFASVSYPTIGPNDLKPTLPLKVVPVRENGNL